MAFQLTNKGEEWVLKSNTDGATVLVGLYNEAQTGGDAVADTDDIAQITTEPGNANYSRKSTTVSVTEVGGAGVWGFDTDGQVGFDFSDIQTTEMVDAWLMVVSYQAAGDGAPTEHLVGTGELSQPRDIGSIDTLNLNAGGAGFTLD